MHQQIDIVALVTRAQHGDRQAYNALYEHFYPYVHTLARAHLHDTPTAQELAHDVLVQAFVKLQQLRYPAAFSGWVRQMTARMAITRMSRSSRHALVVTALRHEATTDSSPLEQLLSRERREQVRQSLERLTPLDRDTLLAFYYHGQSLATISQQAAAPLGTIKRRLHIARKRLRHELECATQHLDTSD
jgi:RNA polymerase sigma-70 factor (ECF subfamily)